MGNSASATQQSVVALRSHLEDLEDRLADLSFDVKLREKERDVREQRRPLVPPPTARVLHMHGATLTCNPAVRITVGPVVGKVSSTTATVLLEVNRPGPITMHACTTDTLNPYGLVMGSVTRNMPAHQPRAFHFTGLAPGYRFHVVTSGVCRTDAQLRVGQFHTIDPASTRTRVVVVAHNHTVEEERPGTGVATSGGGLRLWQQAADAVARDDVDVLIHAGSQVDLTGIVRQAWHWVRRHSAAGLLEDTTTARYAAVERGILNKMRNACVRETTLLRAQGCLRAEKPLLGWLMYKRFGWWWPLYVVVRTQVPRSVEPSKCSKRAFQVQQFNDVGGDGHLCQLCGRWRVVLGGARGTRWYTVVVLCYEHVRVGACHAHVR